MPRFDYGYGVENSRSPLEPLVSAPPEPSIDTLEELPAAIERRVERYDYEAHKRESLTETIPLVVCDRERAASDELAAVLRLIDSGKVAGSDKTRRPTSAAVRAVTAVLGEGDFYDDEEISPIRAFAWARLRLTAAGRRALAEPPAPALRRAWERWLDTRLLDELGRIDAIKGQIGNGKRGLTAVAGRRGAIAEALACCPVGDWIAVDELFRYMRASGRDFEVTRDAWRLYLGEPNYGSLSYDDCGGRSSPRGAPPRCLSRSCGCSPISSSAPAGSRTAARRA